MKTLRALAWVLVFALPASALGQERSGDKDRGVEVQALGGARGYVGQANDILNTGPAYGVLVGFEPLAIFGFELAYQGASFKTASDLAGAQVRVNQNGAHAVIKASPKIGALEPYAFGGLDVSRITATGEQDIFVKDDTVFALPVGVGIDFHVPVSDSTNLLFGARGSYAFGFGESAFPSINQERTDWIQVGLEAGAQF